MKKSRQMLHYWGFLLLLLGLFLSAWAAVEFGTASAALGGGAPRVPMVTATLTPCAGGVQFLNRVLTNTDPLLTPRLVQNGTASVCGTQKPFPGTTGTGSRHYDVYTMTNNTVNSQCVTVTLLAQCGANTNITSAAYHDSFNPNNLSQNYLADAGTSIGGTDQLVYSFDAQSGQRFVVVVYEVSPNTGCPNYTLRVDACLTGPGTATRTRTTTPARTFTPTSTVPPTNTSTPAANSPTRTFTSTPSHTPTPLPSVTGPPPTNTPTNTPTNIPTNTPTGTTALNSPTRTITRTPTQASGATGTPTACPIQFTDVDQSNPFYAYIRCLACRSIVSGYSGSPPCTTGVPCFLWGNNVTRGQMTKFISNAANYQDVIPPNRQTFADVPNSNTFWLFVERVYQHSVINGYNGDGVTANPCTGGVEQIGQLYFRWCANVTRGQTTKFVSQSAGYADVIPPTQQTFADVPNNNTFWLYVERVTLHGVVSGYTTSPPCTTGTPCFLWSNNVTRGQTAKFISNAFFPNCVTP